MSSRGFANKELVEGDRKQMATMTKDKQVAFARQDELVIQDLPDEVLIYDLKSHKAHCLNGTAAFIWKHCDGKTTAPEIAKLMEKEWSTAVSEEAVWFALDKLSKAELLQERITLPSAQAGMSRRSAVKRLGFGALLAVPVVMSIVTPAAAAAASVPVVCQSCIKKSNGITSCPTACAGISGTCFGNSGCGAGQACQCLTCADCFNNLSSDVRCQNPNDTLSWVVPGSLGC